jgi:hypothetical protein
MVKKFCIFMLLGTALAHAQLLQKENVVEDAQTRLQWQDDALSATMNHAAAQKHCKELRLNDAVNWRLPTLEELKTVVGNTGESPAIKKEFRYTAPQGYWCSDTFEGYPGFAWMIHFRTGKSYKYAKSTPIHVRCVRNVE